MALAPEWYPFLRFLALHLFSHIPLRSHCNRVVVFWVVFFLSRFLECVLFEYVCKKQRYLIKIKEFSFKWFDVDRMSSVLFYADFYLNWPRSSFFFNRSRLNHIKWKCCWLYCSSSLHSFLLFENEVHQQQKQKRKLRERERNETRSAQVIAQLNVTITFSRHWYGPGYGKHVDDMRWID